jgi:hypothetical protein
MITEDYISFETAKLLKEKWFKFIEDKDELSKAYIHAYTKEGKEVWGCYSPDYYPCITMNMAMKWLREKYNLFIQVTIVPHTTITMEQKYYLFSIHKDRRRLAFRKDFPSECYFSYEQACEAGIKYCLENLI